MLWFCCPRPFSCFPLLEPPQHGHPWPPAVPPPLCAGPAPGPALPALFHALCQPQPGVQLLIVHGFCAARQVGWIFHSLYHPLHSSCTVQCLSPTAQPSFWFLPIHTGVLTVLPPFQIESGMICFCSWLLACKTHYTG